MPANDRDKLTVGLAQIAPVWLDREATLAKVVDWIGQAASAGCSFVAFGEALVPGYPFWIEHTDGARWDSALQKDIHAHYLDQAVQVEAGHLDGVCAAAARLGIAIMLGTIERPSDRGGHSVYCSRVHVGADGKVASVHRKLLPTYEERLSWAPGDGHGLQVHPVGPFRVGGLNCYENWMPLSRAALYAQGENLHVALWPGSLRNTGDTTRFLAREGRSYVLAVSGHAARGRAGRQPGSGHAGPLPGRAGRWRVMHYRAGWGVGDAAGDGAGTLGRGDAGPPRGTARAAEL